MNDEMREMSGPVVSGVKPMHVWGLWGLVGVLAVALVVVVFVLQGRIAELDKKFGQIQEKQTKTETDTGEAVKTINAQLTELAAADDTMDKATKEIAGRVDGDTKRIAELATGLEAANKNSEAMKKDLDEQGLMFSQMGKDHSDQIAAVRKELGMKTEELTGTVTNLQKGTDQIASEIDKKADKAYVTFIEKKLGKQITAVNTKLDETTTNLEGQIATTNNRIDKMDSDMNQKIKTEVDSKTKLDFKPATPGANAPTPPSQPGEDDGGDNE